MLLHNQLIQASHTSPKGRVQPPCCLETKGSGAFLGLSPLPSDFTRILVGSDFVALVAGNGSTMLPMSVSEVYGPGIKVFRPASPLGDLQILMNTLRHGRTDILHHQDHNASLARLL